MSTDPPKYETASTSEPDATTEPAPADPAVPTPEDALALAELLAEMRPFRWSLRYDPQGVYQRAMPGYYRFVVWVERGPLSVRLDVSPARPRTFAEALSFMRIDWQRAIQRRPELA